ncbi:transglutaminase domain-containing protein [Geminocystis sp. CENA526]|uniref:transglutaminase domain-containing protein n=1 Tax=Geminocystis sp. CENA526 TaxID=1355871 RepID=UPI003D700AFD
MTTEREYQEWQKRRNKRQKPRKIKRKKNHTLDILYVLIIFTSITLTIKNNPQYFNFTRENLTWQNIFNTFANNSLRTLTQEFITKIDEPIVINNPVNLQSKKFTDIDNKAKSIQYNGNSVQELANILSSYATTEQEKARIIYTWITHNISYDVVALRNLFDRNIYPDVKVETVLNTRSTICSGYANLYQQLAQYMGLKSIIVVGYAKGSDYALGNDKDVNHAWNAVKIDGDWYLIDTTWGSGTVNNNVFNAQFNPYYFATKPEEFIYSHFPENPQWQLLKTPFSREQFENFANISPTLFEHNIQLISHQNLKINTDNSVNIVLKAPQNVVAIAQLKSEEKEIPDNYTFVQKRGENIVVNAGFPQGGNYQLNIFAKPKDGSNNYPLVVTYDISANNKSGKFPTTFQHFSENNGYLEAPLKATLTPNQNTYFKLQIDSATEVKVVDKSTNQWHNLTRYGNVFSGNVNIGNGEVMIYAKFPNDSRYWGLLKYGE